MVDCSHFPWKNRISLFLHGFFYSKKTKKFCRGDLDCAHWCRFEGNKTRKRSPKADQTACNRSPLVISKTTFMVDHVLKPCCFARIGELPVWTLRQRGGMQSDCSCQVFNGTRQNYLSHPNSTSIAIMRIVKGANSGPQAPGLRRLRGPCVARTITSWSSCR